MSVDPAQWIRLAELAVDSARVREPHRDDAIGEVLESFTLRPPLTEALAVWRGKYRAIDYLRSQRTRESAELQLVDVTGDDVELDLVEWIDALERAGLTAHELAAITLTLYGYDALEADRELKRAPGYTSRVLYRARRKLEHLRTVRPTG